MRLQINIKIINYKNLKIPYNLNYEISSFFYSILKSHDNLLHDNKNKKDFCFSNLIVPKSKYEKTNIVLTQNKGLLLFSSSDENKILNIYNNLLKEKNTLHKIGNVLFLVDYIKKYKDSSLKSNDDFINLSLTTPIILSDVNENGKSIFVDISKERYKKLLLNNINRVVNDKITINDIIIDTNTIKRKATKYKNIKLIGYLFNFKIKLSNADFDTIYYNGIGSKTGLGFGFLKVNNI